MKSLSVRAEGGVVPVFGGEEDRLPFLHLRGKRDARLEHALLRCGAAGRQGVNIRRLTLRRLVGGMKNPRECARKRNVLIASRAPKNADGWRHNIIQRRRRDGQSGQRRAWRVKHSGNCSGSACRMVMVTPNACRNKHDDQDNCDQGNAQNAQAGAERLLTEPLVIFGLRLLKFGRTLDLGAGLGQFFRRGFINQ